MNLEYKFESKLLLIEKKVIKAKQALSYLLKLLDKIKKSTKNEEVKQIYIRKGLEVVKIETLIKQCSYELSIFIKHKVVITENEKRIFKILVLLEELDDRVINTIATLQSMIIYLGYSDYK